MKHSIETDVAIVGAGISGLLAARRLQAEGLRAVVFDKSRGVGGRMATRRSGESVFDHGAQYFTARNPDFRRLVEDWHQRGLLKHWSNGFVVAGSGFKQDGEARWTGVNGMTTVAKHLAVTLDVRKNSHVRSVVWNEQQWSLRFEDDSKVTAPALLLTAPIPQSLGMIDAGDVELPFIARKQLESIEYAPCIAVMVKLAGPSQVPTPGGLWTSGEPIAWISDNSQKGIAPLENASITLHAGPTFSRENWRSSDTNVTDKLLHSAQSWLGDRVRSTQLHRWRYSIPERVLPERCLSLDQPGPLVFAGDAFGGPRVEGAALSGLAAAAWLTEKMKLESQCHAV